MTLRHLPRAGFTAKLWKNGLGTTHDVGLYPEGADHNSFDLRFAMSPIVENGIFSAFPGVERVITLIQGDGLDLDFGDAETRLALTQSLRFDSGLTPVGRPVGGVVAVVNVMARHAAWQIVGCGVTDATNLEITSDDLCFVFALADDMRVQFGEDAAILAKHDAAIAEGSGEFAMQEAGRTGMLCAHLKRVTA